MYRIAQEGLNHVVKHAKAREVQIHSKYEEDAVSLEMNDDEVGFDREIASQSGGFGLQGNNERVHQLGGSLEIDSPLAKALA